MKRLLEFLRKYNGSLTFNPSCHSFVLMGRNGTDSVSIQTPVWDAESASWCDEFIENLIADIERDLK